MSITSLAQLGGMFEGQGAATLITHHFGCEGRVYAAFIATVDTELSGHVSATVLPVQFPCW